MSIANIMSTGLSALTANQNAMRATSTNVANVNTKGYSRLDVQFVSKQAQGGLHGVEIEITRVANAYLAAAEMRGAADVAAADILSQFMDRAQGLLGDPSDSTTVFAALDPVFSSFGALAVDPASALRRSAVISDLQTMLAQIDTTAGEIAALRDEAHSRAVAAMEEANSLMSGIARLNTSIQRNTIAGLQASEAETEQQRMLDRLSEIIDIRTQQRPLGGVEIRTTDGLLLVDLDAATIGLSSTSNGEPYPGTVMLAPRSTTETPLDLHLGGGELKGLLRTRDRELVNLQLAFGEYAAGAAEALNAAHNAATAVPAPNSFTGTNTGLIGTDLLNFTGATNIAITNPAGEVVKNFRIDFGAGTITDEAGVSSAFANSVGDLVTQLNTRLGTDGTVSFNNGVMALSADTANNGVVITDDPTSPARRASRGFSHTFGLNDLITKGKPINYATGLSASDLHGFSTGQSIRFALRDEDGAIVRTVNYTITAGVTTFGQLRTALDGVLNGYGQTTFDANGRLTLQPTNNDIARVDVIQDTTARGGTNLSFSDIFGLGETLPAQRAVNQQINAVIRANPNRLSSAQADLYNAGLVNPIIGVGVRVLSPGDGRGALGIEAGGTTPRLFADAGTLTGQVTSITDYAARLAGHAGVRAEALSAAKDAAESVREEVRQRRMGEEGVNLDEELVKMTTYQQAYAAASRMITAARDLYDVILGMV